MPRASSAVRQKGDITSAYKVISSGQLGLSRAEIFVAHAILRHLSASNDTCYPSVERLAAMAGTDQRTVLRATQRLCSGEGRLFDKFRRAGQGRTSTADYTPRWSRFRELEAQIEAVFMGRDDAENQPNSDTGVTLTLVHRTPDNDPQCTTTSKASNSVAEEEPKPKSEPTAKEALDGMGIRLEVAPKAKLPVRGRKKASERWNADLLRCGPLIYGAVIEWMTETVADQATHEEQQKYHRGISCIRDKLMEAGRLDLAANVEKQCFH